MGERVGLWRDVSRVGCWPLLTLYLLRPARSERGHHRVQDSQRQQSHGGIDHRVHLARAIGRSDEEERDGAANLREHMIGSYDA